jgi:hypothetical protein
MCVWMSTMGVCDAEGEAAVVDILVGVVVEREGGRWIDGGRKERRGGRKRVVLSLRSLFE